MCITAAATTADEVYRVALARLGVVDRSAVDAPRLRLGDRPPIMWFSGPMKMRDIGPEQVCEGITAL
jgi:hypothetical protein